MCIRDSFTTSTVFQLPTSETFAGLSNYVYGVIKMGFLSSLGSVSYTHLDVYKRQSLGRLLKCRGLKVASQKLDPYVNVDPGTMSPLQHGAVFVTDDGTETCLLYTSSRLS